ncbi:MAG: hypothetical protein M3Y69_00310, partial [Verrucomicrobiota bacterium]|nr:hypothetical protein [Verrucomicrobiota bacterium]
MQNLGDDFDRLDDRDAGTIEEPVAVSIRDMAARDGAQLRPSGQRLQRGIFGNASLQSETAGCDDQKIRVCFS